MAINSYGYPNTIAPGSVFARYTRLVGHEWQFETEGGYRVTRVTTGSARRVTVQAGWLQAAGILVQTTEDVTLDVPAPSGAAEWKLLVMRLWVVAGETYRSEFAWVAGAPLQARQYPATTRTPGTQFDVPIALCYVTSAAALVQNVIDCRIVANSGGGVQIYTDLMMEQMRAWYGTLVFDVIAKTARMIARNTPESASAYKRLLTWAEGREVLLDNSPGTFATGWGQDGAWTQARSTLGTRHVQLQVVARRWSNGDVPANSSGGMPDTLIYTAGTPYKPYDQVVGSGLYYSKDRGTYHCLVTLDPDGAVKLRSGAPGVALPQINAPTWSGAASIRCSFTYLAKD